MSKSSSDSPPTAIIIGAGPAGLTAAYELSQQSDLTPVIIELENHCGGLSATLEHKGNGIDIGGHRFYSKSSWVMNWWQQFLPLESSQEPGPAVMLVRDRLSRILFRGRLFNYPLSLSWHTLKKLSPTLLLGVGLSYLYAKLRPIRPESNLEDFFINRFGRVLYRTFFAHYTEKVWGAPCAELSAEWGPQRIKGLSIYQAVIHAFKQHFAHNDDLGQQKTETSLIERFLYPARGPGQLWQAVADRVCEQGGQIRYRHRLEKIHLEGNRVRSVTVRHLDSGELHELPCQHLISSMPLRTLVAALDGPVPAQIKTIAADLRYRDYIIVGILLKKAPDAPCRLEEMADNWLYVQEPAVRLGRVQIFNNWSPALVQDPDTLWIGLEYFCQQGDELWQKTDQQMAQFGYDELIKIGLASEDRLLDSCVFRINKAYPSYLGSYAEIGQIRDYLDPIANLYLVGRNGMHRYNNQDHSMLTARAAVRSIVSGNGNKSTIWQVNTEDDYLEEASPASPSIKQTS